MQNAELISEFRYVRIVVTTPGPSSPSNRARINLDERRTSMSQWPSDDLTWSTPSACNETLVARATADPTAARHANSTFSGQSGA